MFAESIAGHTIMYSGVNTGIIGLLADIFIKNGGTVDGALIEEEMCVRNENLNCYTCFASYEERQKHMFSVSSKVFFLPGGLGTMCELFSLLVTNKMEVVRRKALSQGDLSTAGLLAARTRFLSELPEAGDWVDTSPRGRACLDEYERSSTGPRPQSNLSNRYSPTHQKTNSGELRSKPIVQVELVNIANFWGPVKQLLELSSQLGFILDDEVDYVKFSEYNPLTDLR
jgi:predicted Rossmann-fold nucleotide-binding protein